MRKVTIAFENSGDRSFPGKGPVVAFVGCGDGGARRRVEGDINPVCSRTKLDDAEAGRAGDDRAVGPNGGPRSGPTSAGRTGWTGRPRRACIALVSL